MKRPDMDRSCRLFLLLCEKDSYSLISGSGNVTYEQKGKGVVIAYVRKYLLEGSPRSRRDPVSGRADYLPDSE